MSFIAPKPMLCGKQCQFLLPARNGPCFLCVRVASVSMCSTWGSTLLKGWRFQRSRKMLCDILSSSFFFFYIHLQLYKLEPMVGHGLSIKGYIPLSQHWTLNFSLMVLISLTITAVLLNFHCLKLLPCSHNFFLPKKLFHCL